MTPAADDLLRPLDVQNEYRISRSTLATWRKLGQGPAWFKLGARRVVYRRSVIEAWIAAAEKAAS